MVLTSAVAYFALSTLVAPDDAKGFAELPIEPSALTGGAWKLSEELRIDPATQEVMFGANKALGPYHENRFRLLTIDLALKLGFQAVSVEAKEGSALIVGDTRVGYWVPCTLNCGGGQTILGSAFFGSACRLDITGIGFKVDATAGIGSFAIGANAKTISETYAFRSIGFDSYVPCEIALKDGVLDLLGCISNMNRTFDSLMGVTDSTRRIVISPKSVKNLLSVKVRVSDISKIKSATSIEVTP
jgi:hypothetical protein